jgi:hypothetical protein
MCCFVNIYIPCRNYVPTHSVLVMRKYKFYPHRDVLFFYLLLVLVKGGPPAESSENCKTAKKYLLH